jgi:5-methylcytosine-specific restriction endonuclease McrA
MTSAKISQIIDWNKHHRLNFEPAYQRLGGVWSYKDCEELIATILNDLPIPELFLHYRPLRGENFVYDIVDGKQRLQTILNFVDKNKGFRSKIGLDEKDRNKKLFSELTQQERERFFNYDLRFFRIDNFSLENLTEIFIRLNRTGRKLTKQEIRNAKFTGDFISLAKLLCKNGKTKNYFIKNNVVSESAKKRMSDIELTCELLAYIKNGVQDKKKTLDRIIGENEKLKDRSKVKHSFVRCISLIKSILPEIRATRFHQKSDFYSLFGAIHDLYSEGFNIENPKYQKITKLILINLSNLIDSTKSKVRRIKNTDILKYYESTREGTDTKINRTIRIDYLKKLLGPALGKKDKERYFSQEQKRLLWNSDTIKKCAICRNSIETWDDLEIDHKKPWALGGQTQLSNGQIAHARCNRSKGNKRKN